MKPITLDLPIRAESARRKGIMTRHRCGSATRSGEQCQRRAVVLRVSETPVVGWCAQHLKELWRVG